MSHPYTGQKKIKEIIYRLLEPTLERQGWYLSKLMLDWEMLMGAEWKAHVWPARFVANIKDRSKGVLHVKVSHKGMQQVQFTKGFLIEKFNLYLGCEAITDIKPQLWYRSQHNAPSSVTALNSQISAPLSFQIEVQDQSLKTALESLGNVLCTSKKHTTKPAN
jgi:hypothetical protein